MSIIISRHYEAFWNSCELHFGSGHPFFSSTYYHNNKKYSSLRAIFTSLRAFLPHELVPDPLPMCALPL